MVCVLCSSVIVEGRRARADYSPLLQRKYSRFAFRRPFFRDLLSLLAGLRKADGYRLLTAFDLSPFAATAAFCGALFEAAHFAFDVAAGAPRISALFGCLLRHGFLPPACLIPIDIPGSLLLEPSK